MLPRRCFLNLRIDADDAVFSSPARAETRIFSHESAPTIETESGPTLTTTIALHARHLTAAASYGKDLASAILKEHDLAMSEV